MCMTDAGFATHTAYAFLFDVKERFQRKYGDSGKQGIGLGASEFEAEMKDRMEFFNTDPSADRIRAARANIDKTREIMIENIDKVLARGEKIEILVNKTALMSETAVTMRKTATKVKRHMWWKNAKLSLLLVGVILVIILIILLVVCHPDFSKC